MDKVTNKIIHKICMFLEDGKDPSYISYRLNFPEDIIEKIGRNEIYTNISKHYEVYKEHESSYLRNLKCEVVDEICMLITQGLDDIKISEKLIISEETVNNIRNGRSYLWVSRNHYFLTDKQRNDDECDGTYEHDSMSIFKSLRKRGLL